MDQSRYLPTLKQLRYLTALRRAGNFGRAAEICHVTQSTLSAGIQELETLLGAVLVDRTKRLLVFTPLGNEIADRAAAVLAHAEALVDAAKLAAKPLTGVLRLGVIPTISPFMLPKALPRLHRDAPGLELRLKEDLTGRLIRDLEDGELDLALIALPCESRAAETMPLFDDPFVIAAPEGHPIAKRRLVGQSDLAGESLLLLRDGHCLRQHALEACALAGRSHKAVEATSLFTLVQMVNAGLGITLLPEMAVNSSLLAGTTIDLTELSEEAPARTIGLAWRQGSARRPHFEALGERLRDYFLDSSRDP